MAGAEAEPSVIHLQPTLLATATPTATPAATAAATAAAAAAATAGAAMADGAGAAMADGAATAGAGAAYYCASRFRASELSRGWREGGSSCSLANGNSRCSNCCFGPNLQYEVARAKELGLRVTLIPVIKGP